MKKTFGLLLFICATLHVQAQLLWKVSGNGLTQPSYIMGTHHLSPLSIKDSIAGIKQALNDTKQVYGELVMTEVQKPATMQLMQQAMMIGNDTTFQSLFTPEAYERINQYSKENLMFDIAMMPKVKPAFLSNNLVVILYMKHVGGFNPQEQLDTYFQTLATSNGKKVGALETPEFQFNLLYNGSSLKRQAESLLCLLNNIDKNIDQLKRLTVYYNAQNLDAMYKLSEELQGDACDPLPGEKEAMIDHRNRDWATKLPTIMEEAPTFIAVGALHLPGENGLLQLLKQKGYNVEAIK
ncbi:TraB/GumN family protein [Bacteroides sp.]|uniref:TraB/GumN family protein n=1 Tax=Bacteroides sp. TaxID=29523 RepID=UPI001B591EEC|nr:TraB/GumN family protein [Bacteroides sp.]MBP6065867.1 TraB/GumN family protein [Bacteroides sp.]MBP6067920.1 TraB/GumN family protein [Bacteroides sp.]MBP6937220.1 TraB/GumN family protein [Bacteroides sp.]MBP8622776.1 TraB/GumN family protein [Bacteroides sp.]MBP9507521.1 TraB/GumN family protein [Bacteroides sp.]